LPDPLVIQGFGAIDPGGEIPPWPKCFARCARCVVRPLIF